jgi:hypothetical protein
MLATFGGDANAAYRIARCLQNKYRTLKQPKEANDPRFLVFVPTYCKSAGTILVLGADEIIMSPEAELGPIDVQLRKPDEIGELTSGLTPNQAIRNLARHAEDLFKSFFRKLRFDSQLGFSTKMASEVAAQLTSQLLNPVFAQVDPLRLAETERMLEIAVQYGKRLAISNLNGEDALARLVNKYPSHGFVIDFEEAKEIFRTVSAPEDDLSRLAELFEIVYSQAIDRREAFIYYLDPLSQTQGAEDAQHERPDGLRGPDGQSAARPQRGDRGSRGVGGKKTSPTEPDAKGSNAD